jgi:hypothetical protein
LKYLGQQAKTGGPFSTEGKEELAVLTDRDRIAARALLKQGALGFLVFTPDYATSIDTATGPLVMIKVGQVIFVSGDRVVANFRAK